MSLDPILDLLPPSTRLALLESHRKSVLASLADELRPLLAAPKPPGLLTPRFIRVQPSLSPKGPGSPMATQVVYGFDLTTPADPAFTSFELHQTITAPGAAPLEKVDPWTPTAEFTFPIDASVLVLLIGVTAAGVKSDPGVSTTFQASDLTKPAAPGAVTPRFVRAV